MHPYDPEIQTWSKFLYNAPTPKFHHRIFTHSIVIVLTNKQTDTAENIQCSLLCYDLGNKIVIHSRQTIHMCCLYVLDPEPMTVVLHLGLDVMKMYISTRTEVYMSKL